MKKYNNKVKSDYRKVLALWDAMKSKYKADVLKDIYKNDLVSENSYTFYNSEVLTAYIFIEGNNVRLNTNMVVWFDREKGTWEFLDKDKL